MSPQVSSTSCSTVLTFLWNVSDIPFLIIRIGVIVTN